MALSPQMIANKGEALYKNKFQSEYEAKYLGKFVAIDIASEEAFVADNPEDAIAAAQEKNPNGFFHLVKVGSPGVYRLGYTQEKKSDWIFR